MTSLALCIADIEIFTVFMQNASSLQRSKDVVIYEVSQEQETLTP